jgi:hypothetical protein
LWQRGWGKRPGEAIHVGIPLLALSLGERIEAELNDLKRKILVLNRLNN